MRVKYVNYYDNITKEYLGKILIQTNPLNEDEWVYPPNTTEDEIPELSEYQTCCYIDNQWVIKPDYRKVKVYNKQTLQEVKKELGEELTENETLIPPPIEQLQNQPSYKQIRWSNELNNWEIYDDTEIARQIFNRNRENKLKETDWMILRHQDEIARTVQTTLTNEQYQELLNYRQALRDMPEDPNFDIFNPQWPEKPSFMDS